MNEDPLTVTLTQISHLVTTLNKKNQAQSSRQIGQLVKEFGFEADRHYLRCLFSAIDFGDATQVSKNSLQAKLLSAELSTLITKPNYVSNICFAFDLSLEAQKSLKPNASLFANISKALNLTPIKEVVLAYSLTHLDSPELSGLAKEHLKASLLKLIQSYTEVDVNSESLVNDVTPELLQLILSLLVRNQYEDLGLTKTLNEKFLGQLRHDFPRERVPLVLAPLLYADEETEFSVDVVAANAQNILQSSPIMDTSWPKLVMEVGYAFTASVDECKNHLVKVAGREIKATDVAKIVSVMCQTHSGLAENSINLPTPANFWPTDKDGVKAAAGTNGTPSATSGSSGEGTTTWKPEVLVQALKEVAPNVKWDEVCFALDHPGFELKDRQGLMLLLSIIRLGYQSANPAQILPPQCLYRHWENSGGQLSLIHQILKNPDVISFADYILNPVTTDLLKTPPELDNKDVATWKSLHLIEVLLHIADNGFYAKVTEIFKIPIQLCPDLFFFALLQINTPASLIVLRHELFVRLMPIFLGNHPNSATVIQHAWNTASLKPVVLNSIIEWYYRGENDQTRLSRILDVAQDLKALSSLLTVHAFPFSIDLACLASRRGYLKLEKWWNDQVREHRQPFIQATVIFLQRKYPQSIGGKIPDDQLPKAAQLPPETMTTLITCLQTCIGNVSPELNEMILAMSAHCNLLLNSTRQQQQQQQQQQLPPPAVLRAQVPPPPQSQQQPPPPPSQQQQMRALESQFNAANLGGQMFANQNVDAFASAIPGLNLGNNNFNFNMLSNIVSNPVSPSRLLSGGGAPSHSPFSVMTANRSLNLGGGGGVGNRLQPTPPTGDKLIPNQSAMFPDMQGTISKEIEDEANSYFQRIYNHPPHPTLSIEEVLDMLQRFQESQNRRERGVYQCMVRNLFEEYRFFPNYPDKELQITAQLFGGMVDRKLVPDFVVLGLALRCVLDALRKADGTKMYFFGITALDRFKTKLHMYQKYCEHVRTIPHFDQFPAHLIEYVEYGVNGQEPPTKPPVSLMPQMLASTTANALYNRSNSVTSNLSMTGSGGSKLSSATPTAASGSGAAITQSRVKSIASATNIDTLLVANQDREEKINTPPDSIQDKTAFIFNNLSQLNLSQKCEDVKEIMTKEYWSWLAQYLVLRRASIEFNFHTLYSNFLDVLKIPDINRMVTRETFRNIRVLLRSDKSIANFSDRSLLKNLGHWLGMMTLGRSRPILQIDIDLKSLVAEAYLKGQQELLYIVPFVAKVLESCAKSRVFKLPNPWTMAIMNVLAELHQEPDLKLSLRFEIEVLCKNFNIDVSDLKPGGYLREADKNVTEFQLSQPDKLLIQPKDAVLQSPIHPQMQQPNATPNLLGAGNLALLSGGGGVGGGARDDVNVMAAVSPSPGLDGGAGALVTGPPEPKFNYTSIHVSNFMCIDPLMTIAPNLTLFHTQSQWKTVIRAAILRTIGEWMTQVVDRSVKIALLTCEQIIRKDFALDVEEMHMRTAAHYMVRNLTAGMAMITCREQLSQALITNLKTALLGALPHEKGLAESASLVLAADNMELACAFIQKTAAERAVLDIDKRLAADYELRKHVRLEARTILDQDTFKYQCERMPEQIRLTGNVTKHQFAVYEEFVKNIPGFLPITENEIGLLFPQQPQQQQPQQQQQQQPPQLPQPPQQAAAPFGMNVPTSAATATGPSTPAEYKNLTDIMSKCDAFIVSVVTIPALQVQLNNIHTLYDMLRRNGVCMKVLALQSKCVEFLLEGYVNLPEHMEHIKMYRDLILRLLSMVHDGLDITITTAVFDCREDIRYNLEAIDLLIKSQFIIMDHFDALLSHAMENGNNFLAVNFAMKLVQLYLIDCTFPDVEEHNLSKTIDMLNRISAHPAAPEGLMHMMEILRLNKGQNILSTMGNAAGAGGQLHGLFPGVRGNAAGAAALAAGGPVHDDATLQQKIEYLFKDWVTMFQSPTGRDKFFPQFLAKIHAYGIWKTEHLIKFLQHAAKICIDLTYRQLNDTSKPPAIAKINIFHCIDPYVRLITLLMKGNGDSVAKINLLQKVLYIIVEALLKDHEKQGVGFQQVGFHRMLVLLFLELTALDPVSNMSFNVVAFFAQTYHLIRPMMVPGFCYAWLELISHRVFINRCLAPPMMHQNKGWSIYSQLLLDLFNYLAPFLRNAELAKPVQLMYKGTLRILLVLLHDFPEFLCDYHFSFCDVIPPNCIQMRNLILSAFPRSMRMPDPFTPNLKVDMLAETANSPRVSTNFSESITPPQFRQSLDSYLKARAPVTFLSELRSCLQVSNEPGSRYNIPLMNALVLYVGRMAIAHIRSKNLAPNMNTIVHSAHMDIFQNLSVDLENEGRYLFLNAIANQLRYPNSHTNYFSCVLLYLFVEANSEAIQEQITRVLLERLIVNRPHPWGLLITFIELINNPVYKFWEHEFVHCAPEIKRLFESVARSCTTTKTNTQQQLGNFETENMQECN